jgi:hypothetical protein
MEAILADLEKDEEEARSARSCFTDRIQRLDEIIREEQDK